MAGLFVKFNSVKYSLDGQRLKIGRVRGKNEIVIPDNGVSSEHCLINNGVISDAKSSNGTFLNDVELVRGTKHTLKAGDVITISTTKLTVESDGTAPPPTAAAAEDASTGAAVSSLDATTHIHANGKPEPNIDAGGSGDDAMAATKRLDPSDLVHTKKMAAADLKSDTKSAAAATSDDSAAVAAAGGDADSDVPGGTGLLLKWSDKKFQLAGVRLKIGRTKGNDIVINDSTVSGSHCVISNGALTDAKSTAGTQINARECEKKKKYVLKAGDVITITNNSLYIEAVPSTLSAAAAPAVASTATAAAAAGASSSSHASDSDRTSKIAEMKHRREKIMAEIADTERLYTENLKHLLNHFRKPLIQMAREGHADVTDADLSAVFSNIEPIANFHDFFFAELTKTGPHPTQLLPVVMAFLKLADFLKMYSIYINSYELSCRTLAKLQTKKKFIAFLAERRIAAASGPRQLDLMSYLIMPVQRIPRYELLLKEVAKNVDESEVESGVSISVKLSEALTKIQSIAKTLNENKRKAERMAQLVEIQGKLSGAGAGSSDAELKDGIVVPHRELIREGELQKKGGVFGDKTKRVFLFNDMLLWTNTSYKVTGHVPLSSVQVSSKDDKSFELRHAPTKTVLALGCADTASKDQWIKDISDAIQAAVAIDYGTALAEVVQKRKHARLHSEGELALAAQKEKDAMEVVNASYGVKPAAATDGADHHDPSAPPRLSLAMKSNAPSWLMDDHNRPIDRSPPSQTRSLSRSTSRNNLLESDTKSERTAAASPPPAAATAASPASALQSTTAPATVTGVASSPATASVAVTASPTDKPPAAIEKPASGESKPVTAVHHAKQKSIDKTSSHADKKSKVAEKMAKQKLGAAAGKGLDMAALIKQQKEAEAEAASASASASAPAAAATLAADAKNGKPDGDLHAKPAGGAAPVAAAASTTARTTPATPPRHSRSSSEAVQPSVIAVPAAAAKPPSGGSRAVGAGVHSRVSSDPAVVGPAMHAALQAIAGLQRSDINSLKAMKMPTPAVKQVLEATALLLGVTPSASRTNKMARHTSEDAWLAATAMLALPNLLSKLTNFDASSIPAATRAQVKPYTDRAASGDLTVEKVTTSSAAAGSLWKWVLAIMQTGPAGAAAAAAAAPSTAAASDSSHPVVAPVVAGVSIAKSVVASIGADAKPATASAAAEVKSAPPISAKPASADKPTDKANDKPAAAAAAVAAPASTAKSPAAAGGDKPAAVADSKSGDTKSIAKRPASAAGPRLALHARTPTATGLSTSTGSKKIAASTVGGSLKKPLTATEMKKAAAAEAAAAKTGDKKTTAGDDKKATKLVRPASASAKISVKSTPAAAAAGKTAAAEKDSKSEKAGSAAAAAGVKKTPSKMTATTIRSPAPAAADKSKSTDKPAAEKPERPASAKPARPASAKPTASVKPAPTPKSGADDKSSDKKPAAAAAEKKAAAAADKKSGPDAKKKVSASAAAADSKPRPNSAKVTPTATAKKPAATPTAAGAKKPAAATAKSKA